MDDMTKRTELYKQLPLATPFSIHMFVSYFCNFKCNYCLHSLTETQLEGKKFKKQFMDLEVYKKAIDDIAAFGEKIKALIFAGHGEPLLHKDIARMVSYAKEKGIAERVEIVTNGSLLTHKLADELIAAGLDRLRISVQGVNAAEYTEVMGKRFDFDKFIQQLEYFYKSKKETEVYCKIIDIALRSEEQREIFEKIFSAVSDKHAIEYAIPFVQEVDNAALKESFECSKQGNAAQPAKVCSMPFYMMVLAPNGDVLPCCSTDVPLVYGNVRSSSLKQIWQSALVKGFCRLHLLGNREKHPVCSVCSVPCFGLQEGDYLDDYAGMLLEKYQLRGDGNYDS